MNTPQLVLLPPTQPKWTLDEETKRVGRNGLAQARQVLSRHHVISETRQLEFATAA